MISEFEFDIRYINGKENRVAEALHRKLEVNHIATMSSYGIDLHNHIF